MISTIAGRSAAVMGRIEIARCSLVRIHRGCDLGASLQGRLSYAKYDFRIRVACSLRGARESSGRSYIRIGVYFQDVERAAPVGAHIDTRIIATADAGVAAQGDLFDAVFQPLGDLRRADWNRAAIHGAL